MWSPYFSGLVAREHYRDLLEEAAHERLANAIKGRRVGLARLAARPLGYRLLRLSTLLLSYGRADEPAVIGANHRSA